ncbi:hypothetical protein FRB96_005894 [Tulasnella sp. 330]|nr:hypothetical protein FRB96_005894 [Tulasnella sp. 330]
MHPKYYDELVDLAVEDVTYRVSKSLFSQSAPFSKVFCSHPGGQPISLIGATVSEMESLLDVLHARQTEAPLELKIEEWGGALHLATKWGFGTVREHIIKHIEHHSTDQGALDRFELAMKCHVPQWLHPAYVTLCTRSQHITTDEGRRLGYERLTAICRIREIFRLELSKIEVDGCCGECDTCRRPAYRMIKQPCISPPQMDNANALKWISKDKHLEVSFSEVEGDVTTAISVAHPNPPTGASSDTEASTEYACDMKDSLPATSVDGKLKETPSNMMTGFKAGENLGNQADNATVLSGLPVSIIDPIVANPADENLPVEPIASVGKGKGRKPKRCLVCSKIKFKIDAKTGMCPRCQAAARQVELDANIAAKPVSDYLASMAGGVPATTEEPDDVEKGCETTVPVSLASEFKASLAPTKSDGIAGPSGTEDKGEAAPSDGSPHHLEVSGEVTEETVIEVMALADIEGSCAPADLSAPDSRGIAEPEGLPKTTCRITIKKDQEEQTQVEGVSKRVKEEFLLVGEDSEGSDSGWSL